MTAMGELGHILGEDVHKEELCSSSKADRQEPRPCSVFVEKVTLVVQKLPARAEMCKMLVDIKDASKRKTSPISLAWRRA